MDQPTPSPRKTALILSGGGAKGAFQAAAEKYAREVKGYHWDILMGVSVGALNGAMLAMHKFERLWEIWNTITDDQVYTGGFNLWSTLKLLFGARSFYGNQPLQNLLRQEFDPALIQDDLFVGAVSLISGEYILFGRDHPNLYEGILASTVMPIIWSPVDVSTELRQLVDGGVRNISPIGDVLDLEPDEVVIINCSAQAAHPLELPPPDIVQIGLRSLDIVLNELFRSDMEEFLRLNALVKEAAEYGVILHNPKNGKPLKYYDCKVIEPTEPLGDTLDFSQPTIQRSINHGLRRARQVFGP